MAEAHFHRVLRARITEVLVTRREALAEGHCKTYDAYRQEVGYILGMADTLKICEDIEKDMDR